MDNRKSFIVGLKSTKLLISEKKFLIKHKPWGIILFSRNIKNIAIFLIFLEKSIIPQGLCLIRNFFSLINNLVDFKPTMKLLRLSIIIN